MSALRLAPTISYGNVATWLSLLRQDFGVLCRDSGFCVAIGLGLGKGFVVVTGFSLSRMKIVKIEEFYVATGVGRCRKTHCRDKAWSWEEVPMSRPDILGRD